VKYSGDVPKRFLVDCFIDLVWLEFPQQSRLGRDNKASGDDLSVFNEERELPGALLQRRGDNMADPGGRPTRFDGENGGVDFALRRNPFVTYGLVLGVGHSLREGNYSGIRRNLLHAIKTAIRVALTDGQHFRSGRVEVADREAALAGVFVANQMRDVVFVAPHIPAHTAFGVGGTGVSIGELSKNTTPGERTPSAQ